MKIEAIVTTMHQTGIDKYNEMHLTTDAIIANQTNKNLFEDFVVDDKKVRLVSTATRGTGKNRNFGFLFAQADIIHFADDDMIFEEGYEQTVLDYFEKYPDAEALIFNIISLNQNRQIMQHGRERRIKFKHVKRNGICGMFFKADVLSKFNLWSSIYFGPGAVHSSGEDSMLLKDFLDAKRVVYIIPVLVAKVKQEESSWLEGFNEKFFIDRGALLAALYGRNAKLISLYHTFKYRGRYKEYGWRNAYNTMKRGIKIFRKGKA